jgi:two-component SAPR family response regulator
MMPEINGFNLYKKISEIDNKVHVLFLTALSDYSSYMQEPNKVSVVLDETVLERIMTIERLSK